MIFRIFFIIHLIILNTVYSQREHVDGIIAWVETNPILKSEVLQALQMDVMQRGLDLSLHPYYIEDNFDDYLELLINQYVMFEKAKADTLIEVSGDEINLALENELDMMIQRAGSISKLEELLGQPVKAYKIETWDEIEKRLLIDKYQQSFVFNVDISRPEVISFFEHYSDSLSSLPARSSFSLIELPVEVSNEAENRTIKFLELVRDSILSGLPFEEFAVRHSIDPGSKTNGGDLGYIKRGTLVHRFEEVAFLLKTGEISMPFETDFGYHLVQVLDKQGEKVHIRHILQNIRPTAEDIDDIEKAVREIYQQCIGNYEMFDSLAYYYQNEYQNSSAVYDWIPDKEIDPFVLSIMDEYKGESVFLPPRKKLNESYIIILVKDRKNIEKATLENAWQLIESMAKNQKLSNEFDLWINREKENVFIKKS